MNIDYGEKSGVNICNCGKCKYCKARNEDEQKPVRVHLSLNVYQSKKLRGIQKVTGEKDAQVFYRIFNTYVGSSTKFNENY